MPGANCRPLRALPECDCENTRIPQQHSYMNTKAMFPAMLLHIAVRLLCRDNEYFSPNSED
eukprot:4860199-Pyramimonas_sp.AAC.1